MPIRINLLAEAQAAEEMRRKDPVKRAIWLGGFVVFLVLLWSVTLQLKITAVRSDISGLHAAWKGIEVKVKQIDEQRKSTMELERKLSALDQFTTNRMLWATAFDALQHTTLDNIQFVRLKTEQLFTITEGTKPKTNELVVTQGKPATATERIVLTIDGRDYSARPGDRVQKLKQALAEYPYFEANLHRTNKIQLTSLSAPQLESGRSFVGFGLQLFFQETERRLYE